jgi:hypothetical protein
MSEAAVRGKIRNRELALVERDFSGLRWNRITPTDIDAFVEFQDKLFVFIEGKFAGAVLRGGQRLALERLVDRCHVPGEKKYSIAFVVSHDGSDCFDYANAAVVEYRWQGRWMRPKCQTTLKHAIDKMKGRYLDNVVQYRDHAAWVASYEGAE